jgi:HEPN domain-containing protein
MSPDTSAAFRLNLARHSLESARDNFTRSNWRDSALFSRAAIEHAAKAMLACFSAVPRTHEPARILELALEAASFPESCRDRAVKLLPRLGGYGMQEHILLSYGDEEHGIDPWSIVDDKRAASHLADASEIALLAATCCESVGVR